MAGRITDEKFSMMSKTYEDEQAQLKVEIQTLQQEIEIQERQIENLEQFIQRVRKYEDLDELTPYALRELVKAIYIEAPDKSSGKRHQGIRISYDLVGFIPVEELLKQETDRSHAVPEKIRYYFLMPPDHSRKDFSCSARYFVVVLMRVRLSQKGDFFKLTAWSGSI